MLAQGLFCDWFTVTTWSKQTSDQWLRAVSFDPSAHDWTAPSGYEPQRLMQYDGLHHDALFIGRALQPVNRLGDTRSHYMAKASGDKAHALLGPFASPESVKCTRLDVQVTIPLPDDYSAREFVDLMRDNKWSGRGRRPEVWAYDRERHLDGYPQDTVYVGHLTGERCARVYVKPAIEDETGKKSVWLRAEMQYRTPVSDTLIKRYRVHGDSALAAAFAGDLERWPQSDLKASFLKFTDSAARVPAPVHIADDHKAWRWFKTQIFPALSAMLDDHSYAHLVRRDLLGLLLPARKDARVHAADLVREVYALVESHPEALDVIRSNMLALGLIET